VLPLVIIHHLHVEGVPSLPTEDDTPLVVDADRTEPLPAAVQRLEAVAWRYSEISDLGSLMEILELAACDTPQ
jgi:hypothetical protein